MTICKVKNCNKNARSYGWCNLHYQRWLRLGDAEAHTKIQVSHERTIEEFNKAVNWKHKRKCLIWPWPRGKKDSYGRVTLNGVRQLVHRAVCEAANGPPFKGAEACHNCGNGHLGCVNPWHLRWDSHRGNLLDMLAHGTATRGEDNTMSKLDTVEVRKIRCNIAKGATQLSQASKYGVSKSLISAIIKGKRWAWLK